MYLEPTKIPNVWYYCDSKALLGIAQNNEIWGNATSYLNDPTEYDFGFDFIKNAIESIPKQTENQLASALAHARKISRNGLFVVCASAERDSLSQYRLYGGDCGYSVELKTDKRLTVLNSKRASRPISIHEGDFIHSSPFGQWFDVRYDRESQSKLAKAVVDDCVHCRHDKNLNNSFLNYIFMEAALLMKRPEYSSEREVRCFFRPKPEGVVQYRNSEDGITPYIKACHSKREEELRRQDKFLPDCEDSDRDKLPITKIICGPRGYAGDPKLDEAETESIESLFSSNDWKSIPVEKTKTRYR